MALTTSDATQAFKVLGKCAYLAALGGSQADALRVIALGLLGQADTGAAADFDWYNSVITPAATKVKTAITSTLSVSTLAASTANTFLVKALALKAGLDPTTAKTSDILDEVASVMSTNTMYLTPAGTLVTFVISQLGYDTLPTTGTTLIPDSYVTGTKV